VLSIRPVAGAGRASGYREPGRDGLYGFAGHWRERCARCPWRGGLPATAKAPPVFPARPLASPPPIWLPPHRTFFLFLTRSCMITTLSVCLSGRPSCGHHVGRMLGLAAQHTTISFGPSRERMHMQPGPDNTHCRVSLRRGIEGRRRGGRKRKRTEAKEKAGGMGLWRQRRGSTSERTDRSATAVHWRFACISSPSPPSFEFATVSNSNAPPPPEISTSRCYGTSSRKR
jgi:hypothetical protein